MGKNGFVESFLWPGCMWITHAFVALVLFVVLVSAVPRFTAVMEDFDAELPAMTHLLVVLSWKLNAYWYLILPPLAALDFAILVGLSQLPPGFRWLRSLWFNAGMLAAILFLFFSVVGVIVPVADLRGNTLILVGTKDTDELLLHVDALTNLHFGDHDYMTDHALGLADLRVLNLSESDITDAGLERLTGLTNLELLYLFDTQVTPEGVEKLQRALPDCAIQW